MTGSPRAGATPPQSLGLTQVQDAAQGRDAQRRSPADVCATLAAFSPSRVASPGSIGSGDSAQTHAELQSRRVESDGDITTRLLRDGELPNRRSTRDAVPVNCAADLLRDDADDFLEDEHSQFLEEANGTGAQLTCEPDVGVALSLAPEELKGSAKRAGDGAGSRCEAAGAGDGEEDLWMDAVGVLGLEDDLLPCGADAEEHALLAW